MIEVKKKTEEEFEVTVTEEGSQTTHAVTLDDGYYRKLTAGRVPKEDLIRTSFEFLLERESKESILPKFDLTVIKRYFGDYEEKIGSRL